MMQWKVNKVTYMVFLPKKKYVSPESNHENIIKNPDCRMIL